MMDTSGIDLLQIIEADTKLKRIADTEGGEYHGPCPFCGGKDRFIVQVNRNGRGSRWSCRRCSPHWHDAIAYVQERDGLSFLETCEVLGLEVQNRSGGVQQKPMMAQNRSGEQRTAKPKAPALTSDTWQHAAEDFAAYCQETLWSRKGRPALRLLHDRGLPDDIIEQAKLGYNPRSKRAHPEDWGFAEDEKDIWLHQGIVIPWWIRDRLWRVNIRRRRGTPKYIGPRGSANGLYNADAIQLGCTIVMVEGELDALSLMTITDQVDIVPVATGSTAGSRSTRWLMRIALADKVLLAFDADDAGEKAATWWRQKLGSKAQRLKPRRHDVNDMLTSGDDLAAWVLHTLLPREV